MSTAVKYFKFRAWKKHGKSRNMTEKVKFEKFRKQTKYPMVEKAFYVFTCVCI